jgi:hypothetical protein
MRNPMQSKRAEALRREWGDKPCEHPDFDREYYLGTETGDYVCTRCGEAFTRAEKERVVTARRQGNG